MHWGRSLLTLLLTPLRHHLDVVLHRPLVLPAGSQPQRGVSTGTGSEDCCYWRGVSMR